MQRRRIAALLLAGCAASALAQPGDAARGAQLYESRCGACHSLEADRVGPRHAGVVGRKAGAVPGFDYSPALRSSKLVWDDTTLDRWLADPQRTIPGQRMNFNVEDAKDRADLIAFLRGAR